jgi:hypothetical protein
MPVENRKSTIVGNADAAPAVLTSPRIAGGHLRAQVATIEVAAADDDTSVYRLFRLPSNAKVTSISVFNDAITGGTSYDIGLYRTAADGGAAVDVDAFASAVDMSSARASAGPLNVTFEAQNIDKIEQELWQVAAATTDPSIMYDVALTANTVGTGAGTISAIIEYIS